MREDYADCRAELVEEISYEKDLIKALTASVAKMQDFCHRSV